MRRHRGYVLALVTLVALPSCQDSGVDPSASFSPARAEASREVPPRSSEPKHSFVHLSDAELWRYISDSDNTVLLGMKMPGAARGIYRERVLIGAQGKLDAERTILAVPGVRLVSRSNSLPILQLHLASFASLVALRRSPFVDYVEPVMLRERGAGSPALSRTAARSAPAAFDISENGSSCSGLDDWPGDIQDQASVLGDVVGWSQGFHYTRVTEAWGRSQGDNIRVAIIDTGVDPAQEQFADGNSRTTAGRFGRRIRTLTFRPLRNGRIPVTTERVSRG